MADDRDRYFRDALLGRAKHHRLRILFLEILPLCGVSSVRREICRTTSRLHRYCGWWNFLISTEAVPQSAAVISTRTTGWLLWMAPTRCERTVRYDTIYAVGVMLVRPERRTRARNRYRNERFIGPAYRAGSVGKGPPRRAAYLAGPRAEHSWVTPFREYAKGGALGWLNEVRIARPSRRPNSDRTCFTQRERSTCFSGLAGPERLRFHQEEPIRCSVRRLRPSARRVFPSRMEYQACRRFQEGQGTSAWIEKHAGAVVRVVYR